MARVVFSVLHGAWRRSIDSSIMRATAGAAVAFPRFLGWFSRGWTLLVGGRFARCNASCARGRCGQMTVELMAVLPVAIVIAAVAVNVLAFFGDCAEFDRISRNAVRVYATSPTYGVQAPQCQASVANAVRSQMDSAFEEVSVSAEHMGGGLTRYVATLEYAPNFFGLGVRDSVFGVQLPRLRHSTSLVVDMYKPGIFFE